MPETRAPSEEELKQKLGTAFELWNEIVSLLRNRFGNLESQWMPSKSDFARLCRIRHKKRTILYLTPDDRTVLAAIVLGERAANFALASDLPQEVKDLIREARPYAEGRGIRFEVARRADVRVVERLVDIKMA